MSTSLIGNTSLSLEEIIINKYGLQKVEEEIEKLCNNCLSSGNCNLLPICTNGESCPYFIRRIKIK